MYILLYILILFFYVRTGFRGELSGSDFAIKFSNLLSAPSWMLHFPLIYSNLIFALILFNEMYKFSSLHRCAMLFVLLLLPQSIISNNQIIICPKRTECVFHVNEIPGFNDTQYNKYRTA
jgi:hypothetical protein